MSQESLDHLNALLAEVREEIARVEAKASTLFAATGVLLAIVTALATSSSNGHPTELAARASLVAGSVAIIAANAALAASIWPRRPRPSTGGWPQWFGEVALEARQAGGDTEGLHLFTERLATAAPDPFARACHQLWHMSRIAHAKQSAVRVAVVLFKVGAFLIVAPALVHHLNG